MQQNGLLFLSRFIDVGDVVALRVLHIDLHCGQSAGLVQGIHEVELELEHEVKEPLIPHLDEDGLMDDVHQALDKLTVLVVEVFGEADGHLVVGQIDAHLA